MNRQITETKTDETRMNVEVEIGESAAYSLIALIENNLNEMGELMDNEEYSDLSRVMWTLSRELY